MAYSDNQQQELDHEEAGQTPASTPAFLILGRILRPHGIRGELRLQIVTQFPERIASLEKVYIGQDPYDAGSATAFEVEGARRHHDQVLVRLKKITSRNDAEAYRNQWLDYAWNWIRRQDANGWLQMPGSRTLAAPAQGKRWYWANTASAAVPTGFNQEETIKAIWARHVRTGDRP